jgi:hypothetical protein
VVVVVDVVVVVLSALFASLSDCASMRASSASFSVSSKFAGFCWQQTNAAGGEKADARPAILGCTSCSSLQHL